MEFRRKTSSYRLEVTTMNPGLTLDGMLKKCQALDLEVDTSGVYRSGSAHLRFRCKSEDNNALNIALQIAEGREFVLTTGYGVNQREIAQ